MMLRKLAVSLALAGVLSTSNAFAPGLGEIKVNSALNEPLNAEIELVEARKLNPLQIQPRLADINEYALAGIDKKRFLSDVNFKVFVDGSGNGRIRLTSPAPIREPFLNFLVELNWPNGRLVREYTVLLDPPVYNPSKQRATVQPVLAANTAVSVPTSAQPAAPAKNIRTQVDQKRQVFVDVHDSLWSIADKYRPNESITKSQMALALLKKNPGAFVTRNINRMKAGVVLNLPTLAEITTLTPEQASAEVMRQNREWKNRGKVQPKPAKPAPVAPVAKAPAPKPEKVAEAKTEEKPALVPAPLVKAETDAAPEGGLSEEDKQIIQDLEDARLALEQELETAASEQSELRSEKDLLQDRLDMLQTQISAIEQGQDSKDQIIAELEEQLREQQERLSEAEKDLLTKILENPMYLAGIGGGAALILLGLLVVILLRRRKAKKAEAEEAESKDIAAPIAAAAAGAVAADALADDDDTADEAQSEEMPVGEDIADISVDDDMDALSDIDLDMDLDLDLDADESGDNELNALLEDDEFDLGLDEGSEASEGDDAELEQLLTEDLGDDLADADLSLDSDDLSDTDLEFTTPQSEPETDELDDILGADDGLEFTSSDSADTSVEDLDLDFGLDDVNLDDVESSETESVTDDDLDADELLRAVEQASSEALEESELEETSVADDDIDALLAEVAADPVAETPELDTAADIDDIDALLDSVAADDDLASNDDLDALFAAPEAAEESSESDPDDIDALLDSVALDMPEPESAEDDAIDALLASASDSELSLESQEDDSADVDDIDALL